MYKARAQIDTPDVLVTGECVPQWRLSWLAASQSCHWLAYQAPECTLTKCVNKCHVCVLCVAGGPD